MRSGLRVRVWAQGLRFEVWAEDEGFEGFSWGFGLRLWDSAVLRDLVGVWLRAEDWDRFFL